MSMSKVLLLGSLVLAFIVLIAGLNGSSQPNVKISTCQLKDSQLSTTQTTTFTVVVQNQDNKTYQNSLLIIDRNPKVFITDSGSPVGQQIRLQLQPAQSSSQPSQISKAFDIQGSLESDVSKSEYPINVKVNIDGNDVTTATCTQTLKVVP